MPYFLSLPAEPHDHAGAVNDGLDVVTKALDRVTATGEPWFEAELHRMMGELMLLLPRSDPTAAEARFARAAATARQ
ncbi:hypothetical protein [Bradyrhizobium sp. CSA112]|uniref:hypothetical protein n=1 Tax=Bradyrhizobium sp. CSA112 TaxID=2699170 RepID=UPI0023AFC385|nr:hypothetical protein [Bradyrhizobium sp. CSA112]